jgi:hypothetical protein
LQKASFLSATLCACFSDPELPFVLDAPTYAALLLVMQLQKVAGI